MEHRFYNKSKKEQTRITMLIICGSLMLIITIVVASFIAKTYLLGILLIFITLLIIAPFIDTPSLRKKGELIYYSSMLIGEKPKNGIIQVHGGTLFDYVFVLEKNMSGKERTEKIIQQYFEGLLKLIEKYQDSDILVRGTTYILNEKTIKRLGFKVVQTDPIKKIILHLNYVNILISNSIAQKKLTFPNLKNTRTFEASICDLLSRKEYLIDINEKLKSKIASRP